MRASPSVFFWVSLAAHVAVGVAIYGKGVLAPPAHREAEAVFSGDTFEVPVELRADPRGESPTPLEPASAPERAAPVTPAGGSTAHNARAPTSARDPGGDPKAGEGESSVGTIFGATGERASVDLATAFTRGFPQAASADPLWVTAPFGSAGEATVVLEIDASGALIDSRIEGAPGPALRSGLLRTVALVKARAFTATQPTTRLHVSARVSPDEVHDGLHGEVFAIGGSFDASQGSAFFALAIGRRVDVRVRE